MQKLAFIAFLFALMISLFGVARRTNNPIQKQGQNIPTLKLKEYMANRPVGLIPVPSGLSAYLLQIPLRGQEKCRKQAGIGHWGGS